MKEKVYCAHGNFDSIILSGTADCEGHPCYFSFLPDGGVAKDGTQIYLLTLLDEKPFALEIENWNYWLDWLTQDEILHPGTYAELRQTSTVEDIIAENKLRHTENWTCLDNYYQNQLTIDLHLKNNPPKIQATAIFHGDRDGTDTQVEWTIINRISENRR